MMTITSWADDVQVKVANIPGKKVEHQGIKVQLLGQIELASERGHPHTFISLGTRTKPVHMLSSEYCCKHRVFALKRSTQCTMVSKGIQGSAWKALMEEPVCSERSGTSWGVDLASDAPL